MVVPLVLMKINWIVYFSKEILPLTAMNEVLTNIIVWA